MGNKRSEKHEQARTSLPDLLKPIFDDFVNDYRFFAVKHHGSPFVSYGVLAEMVKAGWRLAAKPLQEDVPSSSEPAGDQGASLDHE
jgi:hypothetical protein